jgi:hypothetical protein
MAERALVRIEYCQLAYVRTCHAASGPVRSSCVCTQRLCLLYRHGPRQVGGEAGLQRLVAQAGALQRGLAEASARLAAAERGRQADRAYLPVGRDKGGVLLHLRRVRQGIRPWPLA